MAHYKIEQSTDPLTGMTTVRPSLAAGDIPPGAETIPRDTAAAIFGAVATHTIKATRIDYVVGHVEQALRAGTWTPEAGPKILAAIDHLRRMVDARNESREAVAVAGIRVGSLVAEALAKARWPIVKDGRDRRRAQRSGGTIEGRKNRAKAAKADPRIERLFRRWTDSDELQDKYRSPVPYIQADTGLHTRTIQRRIKALRKRKRDKC